MLRREFVEIQINKNGDVDRDGNYKKIDKSK